MLKLDEHEKNINELADFLKVEGIDQAKVSTILQSLRENYSEVDTSINDSTKKIADINVLNEGLRSANMNLLSKLGTSLTDLGAKGKETETEKPKNDAKSFDDIVGEFLK